MEIFIDGIRFCFEIIGIEARLINSREAPSGLLSKAIEEFLFYSGFISMIRDESGVVLLERGQVEVWQARIAEIQPTQFYINSLKLDRCLGWICGPQDIYVPVAMIDGRLTAVDGHTRLKAAQRLGYEFVNIYLDDDGDYIRDFADMAIGRGIRSVCDMKVIDDAEYRVLWNGFCDEYFGR